MDERSVLNAKCFDFSKNKILLVFLLSFEKKLKQLFQFFEKNFLFVFPFFESFFSVGKMSEACKSQLVGKRRRSESYSTYILKVLNQVHPDLSISRQAIKIINIFMNDIFEKVASESANLCRYNKKSTLTSREIQSAVRLIIPGELGTYAVYQGTKAIKIYTTDPVPELIEC